MKELALLSPCSFYCLFVHHTGSQQSFDTLLAITCFYGVVNRAAAGRNFAW